MMDQTEFGQRADTMLDSIAEAVEGADSDWDVEFEGGILTIEAADGGQFVINKHAPNRQIWLSSPKSGAWHFAWDEASARWISTRDGSVSLNQIVAKDLGVVV